VRQPVRRPRRVAIDSTLLVELRRSGLTLAAIGLRLGVDKGTVRHRLDKLGANFIVRDCSMCAHLAGRVREKDDVIERLRQAYRELEDALAVADARLPESITPRDRALTVAIYERSERRQRADE
jgi:DNA-binding transcriptional ArsR family regulator